MPQFKRPQSPRPQSEPRERAPEPKAQEPAQPLVKNGINEELSINDRHINEELIGQPMLMRKYTRELSQLRKKVKAIANRLELAEGKLKIKLSNDGKGRKVAEIEAMVVEDVEIQKLRIELYDAEELENEYEGIVKAVSQRMEMLKELCANLRKEMVL